MEGEDEGVQTGKLRFQAVQSGLQAPVEGMSEFQLGEVEILGVIALPELGNDVSDPGVDDGGGQGRGGSFP